MVGVALCNGMGHLRGEQVRARAEVLTATETSQIEDLVRHKYRWDLLIIGPLRWAQRTFHLGKEQGPTVGLAITPDAPD